MREQRFEEEPGPRFRLEESAPFPRVRRDEVGLRIVRCVLACRLQNLPSAAKAAVSFRSFAARLKSCPFNARISRPSHALETMPPMDCPSSLFAFGARLGSKSRLVSGIE